MADSNETPTYTLITGASSGLGKSLAFECAARKKNLVLVALPDDGLDQVISELSDRFPIKIRKYESDLSDTDDFNDLIETLKYLNIDCLINNVGVGGTLHFSQISEEYLQRIINLNVRCTTLLTYHLLPQLCTHRKSHIINISSIISQYPVAFKTIYPASKSFIYSFSLGLREELKNSSVCVSVALPGPMITNRDVQQRIMDKQGRFARSALLTPDEVAGRVLDRALEGRGLIIPGLVNKLYWYLMKIIPCRVGVPYLSGIFNKEILASSQPDTKNSQPVDYSHEYTA